MKSNDNATDPPSDEPIDKPAGEAPVSQPGTEPSDASQNVKELEAMLQEQGFAKPRANISSDFVKSLHISFCERVYYFLDEVGRYRSTSGAYRHVARKLRLMGVEKKEIPGIADGVLADVERQCAVDYAGPLAGNPGGPLTTCDGRRLLNTVPTVMMTPSKGDWRLLERFFTGLFGTENNHIQLSTLYGWTRRMWEGLAESIRKTSFEVHAPGQVLVVAGPVGNGKTLLSTLLSATTGCPVAKPHQYFTGQTSFNADTASAVILCIDDEAASKNPRDRSLLAAKLKEAAVNHETRLHGKGQMAITVRLFQRVMFAVNCDPEDLQVLPILSSSVEDKIMLLLTNAQEMPMPTKTAAQQAAFKKALLAELPAFMWYVLHEWKMPQELEDGRYGVKTYHHPTLKEDLVALNPEETLLEMLEQCYQFEDAVDLPDLDDTSPPVAPMPIVLGSTTEIHKRLGEHFGWPMITQQFHYVSSMGTALRRLTVRRPERLKVTKTGNKSKYHLYPGIEENRTAQQ